MKHIHYTDAIWKQSLTRKQCPFNYGNISLLIGKADYSETQQAQSPYKSVNLNHDLDLPVDNDKGKGKRTPQQKAY